MNETKLKIIKSKLLNLYDGDNAIDLSIDEILDHIAFRIN